MFKIYKIYQDKSEPAVSGIFLHNSAIFKFCINMAENLFYNTILLIASNL